MFESCGLIGVGLGDQLSNVLSWPMLKCIERWLPNLWRVPMFKTSYVYGMQVGCKVLCFTFPTKPQGLYNPFLLTSSYIIIEVEINQ